MCHFVTLLRSHLIFLKNVTLHFGKPLSYVPFGDTFLLFICPFRLIYFNTYNKWILRQKRGNTAPSQVSRIIWMPYMLGKHLYCQTIKIDIQYSTDYTEVFLTVNIERGEELEDLRTKQIALKERKIARLSVNFTNIYARLFRTKVLRKAFFVPTF